MTVNVRDTSGRIIARAINGKVYIPGDRLTSELVTLIGNQTYLGPASGERNHFLAGVAARKLGGVVEPVADESSGVIY